LLARQTRRHNDEPGRRHGVGEVPLRGLEPDGDCGDRNVNENTRGLVQWLSAT
jgi:hypothetical protein